MENEANVGVEVTESRLNDVAVPFGAASHDLSRPGVESSLVGMNV
ncbi:hypothetical protein A2U01_0035029 [Trifolium medium]|uniref:Uncharacterized protein n=1 Tax=Trifolium medium TaxID=97028 RepID=A0A392PQI4_9FABA|nr:hypothetical protein [Trifolium medium]